LDVAALSDRCRARYRSAAVRQRFQITWSTRSGTLLAIEPRADEIVQHAAALTVAYNDPHNAPLLGHTEHLSEHDVIAHYHAVARTGGHNFLILRDGALVGDADLRHLTNHGAEIAFMVAAVSAQGHGLGTQIATMVNAFAFSQLRLARVYASIIPTNIASRRVFAKLGYTLDDSATGRAFADEPDDLVMSIERTVFETHNATALHALHLALRP
jgi:RimJ/RimL family protein N-acetyltransferase